MVIGRMRRTLKRSLSIAMAAALMVTSVPQLSVTSAAQEEVQNESHSEEAESSKTEAEESQTAESKNNESEDKESSDKVSTDKTDESTTGVDQEDSKESTTKVDKEDSQEGMTKVDQEDSKETQQTSTEQTEKEEDLETETVSNEEKTSEIESELETETATDKEDDKELKEDKSEKESKTEEDEKKVQDSEEKIEGKTIYENDFNSETEGTSLANGTVAKLADGNMAVEYDADLTQGWTKTLNADSFSLENAYTTEIKEKVTMIFDVYFPDSVGDIGTIKAQAVLRNGGDWDWKASNKTSDYTTSDLVTDEVTGYKKLHVSIEVKGGEDWELKDITSLRAITPCLAGDTSTYQGKLYIDNVKLIDTSTATENEKPSNPEKDPEGKLIYKNDLNNLQADTEMAGGIIKQLEEGNMAVEYDADLTKGWTKTLNADSFSLENAYTTEIKEKVTMIFDVYFPDSVGDIGTIKAQAVLRNGGDWDWKASNKTSDYTTSDLVTDEVAGYKKLHVSIEVKGGDGWELKDITSLRAITPCLAGDTSTYQGKLYIDNVKLIDTSISAGEDDPDELEGTIIYEGSKAADKGLVQVEVAKNDFNMEKVVAGGYFYVEYEADTEQDMKLALSEWDTNTWAEVSATESGTKETKEGNLYYAKYSFAACATAYGKDNMSDVDAIATKVANAEYTLKCIKWYGPKVDIEYQLLYKGTSTTLKGPSAGAAHYFYTKHVGGDFDNYALDEGSCFTLEYTSTIDAVTDEKSNLTIALSSVSDTNSKDDNHWVAVSPSTTEKLENGNYLSTYTIADCIKEFGQNLNRLDQVQVYTSWDTAENAEFVLKEMKYYPGNGTLVDPNGETKWTNKRTTGVGFIGDSICQNAMLRYGNWNTILDRSDSVDTNWGIGGQNTTQISRRIDDVLDAADYDKIVVLCGINDLGHGITKDQFIENYTTIIKKIHTAQPETEIFAISILPTTPVFYADQQSDIKDRNTALKALTEEYEYVTYVDCHSKFYDESTGYCKEDYVFDGLHPNETGYGVIAEVLNPLLGESEPNNPDKAKDIIYENNFDEVTDFSNILSENVNGANPALAELATGNKAVKYSVSLNGEGWEDIFKAQFNLSEPYEETITDKVVMSYDVYIPTDKAESFGPMKAQAALSCGSGWDWVAQKSWPEFKVTDLADDESTPGYKKVHVEIDMNDFQIWDDDLKDNKPYPFENITPIQAVIPCFAGAGSTYKGDLYLDNLVVKAVNESGDLPPVEGDLDLALDASAWEVTAGYQYTGQSAIRNENIGDKNFLVFNMDYSKDSAQGWSEAKFDYTHSDTVATLQGYNAFKADIYYKPADMTSGSFGIKLFSNSPEINKDATIPAGESADIDGLEGYYKAEYVLNLKIPAGEFQNLTLGFVGKNTDYKGDIYLDNMRFTQIVEEDVYVDSTEIPVKGSGIQIVDDGRSIQTASGNKYNIASEVALVDANADEATKNLYAYLKAIGDSDSVIFGHQNDTHHKAGSKGDEFTNSDTKDITGSIAGVIGIDALSLTGNEASTWDAPESERIAKVVAITKEAAAEGALVTLSAHMPNFDVIDKRVKAYEESGKTGTDSDSVGYWEVNGEKQYNFSGYTPGTLTGNVVARVMPGQDLNYLYTDYLDLIADYAKAVEGDGITILFRPLHENTGSWFWWGAALCDEQAYIALYRYTVNYLKDTRGVHNILYVYGPGSEAANVTEYGARYPGDAYVDMIGYDLYHQKPSPENEAGYLQSIRKQNAILREFATEHNKLYAITETGVADQNASGEDVALQRTGNKVMDWYMQLLDEINDAGVCYFLVWANFSENGSFYLPYIVEKKENGVLHGHEMMDEFIKFYNDDRSVFATDMNGGFANISGVTNTTQEGTAAGYIIAPQSGDRILAGNQTTQIVAVISGDVNETTVQFIAAAGDKQVVLDATYNEQQKVWEALLTDEDLLSLGEIPGTISLIVDQKEIAVINARFNLKAPVQDDMVPEDFESYAGSNRELNSAWPTNKDSGSEITLVLTEEKDKVFGGKYGMQMNITLAKSDAWVGATKSFEADWSEGNALELYTIPEQKGQKVVVQVKSAGEEFEVYLQEYEAYTSNAAAGTPVKVTIPFSAFVGKNNGVFDPSKIEVIGLWCNAIATEGLEFPLSTTICYDEMRVVTTDKTEVQIEPLKDNGSGDNDNNDNNNNNVTGHITAPASGEVLIPSAQGQGTRIAAKVSGVDKTADVQFVVASASREERLKASYNEGRDEWEAVLQDSVLENLGEGSGTIKLLADNKELEAITVKFGKTEQGDIIAKKGIWVKPIPTQAYTGKAIKPEVVVYDDGKMLTQNKEYTVSYRDNVNASTAAKVIIKGKGNYTETIETVFTISPKQITEEMITYPDYLAFNNKDQKINVTVKDGKKKLSSTKNYTQTITYNGASVTKAKAVGTYQIKISGMGNYSGVLTLNCEMVTDKQLLSKASVKLPASSLNYNENGSGVTFDETKIKVKLGKKIIPQKEADGVVNYTIEYENNQKPGTATVIIKAGAGSKYVGSCRKNFTVKGKKFSASTINITGLQTKTAYTGDARLQQLSLTDKSSNKKLAKDVDYQVAYENNLNAGKATIILTGCGSYSGTIKKTYTISRINLTTEMIKSKTVQAEQSRAGAAPDIVLTYMGKTLVRDRDYTLSYTNNTHVTTNAKKAYISVTGKGNYAGKLNKAVELQIIPKSWQSADITIEVPDMKYTQNKKEYKPNLAVYDNGKKLTKGKDYTVTYESNTKQDAANMTAEGHVARAIVTVISPDYADRTDNDKRIAEFRIINKLISQAKVEFVNPQYFSQLGTRPSKNDLRVTYQGATVSVDEYEIISYSPSTGKGKATIVLQGKKQYGGTKKVTYTVKAKGMHSNIAKALLKMTEVLQ